jgi:hypothetical protein
MNCSERLQHEQSGRCIAAGPSRSAKQQRRKRMIRHRLEDLAGLLRRESGIALQ